MLSSVVRALKALIVTLLGLVRRVLCFLNRSKKDKNDYEPILATSSVSNSSSSNPCTNHVLIMNGLPDGQ